MKKKILTLVAMATLVTMMTACGTSETKDTSTTPTTTPVVTVEPTEVPEVTVEPTVEPTEVPEVTPTETPVKPEITVEPTQAPTEAPEVTVEPTETPAEPTEVPSVDVAEDPNFAVIRDMAHGYLYEYSDVESIIETMDKSRYEVTAVEGLDPVLRAGLTDAEKEDNIKRFLELYICTAGKVDGTYYSALTPTGELYTMTLTDLVTGETIVWGFRVHAENSFKPGTYVVQEFSTICLADMYTGSIEIDNSYVEEIKFILGF